MAHETMMLGTHELVASEFRSLSADVRDAGLLDRRPHYYGAKIAFTVAAFAAGWVGLFALRHSWVVLADAGFLGLMFTQLGFLAHDAGHLQIFQSRRANKLLGFLLANLLIGLSFGWWVPKHNAHHAHPNELGRDPDLGEGGVGGVARRDESAAPPSMLARHHAPVFFALMILRSTGMHVSGALRLLRQRDRPAGIESLLIAVHMVVYLGLLVWQLSPTKALAFIAVQQATFSFYLGLSFAPNHKGMPVITSDSSLGFAERQVVTARNLAGGRCITLMFGGLNYQIEHHLFPTMPRPNLARAQHLVRAFCSDSGLSYHEESLRGSFRAITESLRLGAVAAMPPQIDAIAVAAQPPGS